MPWVQAALGKTQEVGCNLDQDPSFAEHCGTILPVVLASVSNMYGCLRERVMHPNELLLAQGIPVYPDVAAAAGFEDGVPVNFKGVSDAQKRRMAGNSFQQACSNGLMTFVLASMHKK
ncbi:unnamed protein product [Cladocopium goreaui]|nr:unnamed protein product [Cladocopium goreaui]